MFLNNNVNSEHLLTLLYRVLGKPLKKQDYAEK